MPRLLTKLALVMTAVSLVAIAPALANNEGGGSGSNSGSGSSGSGSGSSGSGSGNSGSGNSGSENSGSENSESEDSESENNESSSENSGSGNGSGTGVGGGDTSNRGGHVSAEARRTARCTLSSTVRLQVKPDDGLLEIELEVDAPRAGVAWRVVLLHERMIVLRRVARTSRPSGSFELHRTVRDWNGSEAITARATAVSGETCRVTVVL